MGFCACAWIDVQDMYRGGISSSHFVQAPQSQSQKVFVRSISHTIKSHTPNKTVQQDREYGVQVRKMINCIFSPKRGGRRKDRSYPIPRNRMNHPSASPLSPNQRPNRCTSPAHRQAPGLDPLQSALNPIRLPMGLGVAQQATDRHTERLYFRQNISLFPSYAHLSCTQFINHDEKHSRFILIDTLTLLPCLALPCPEPNRR